MALPFEWTLVTPAFFSLDQVFQDLDFLGWYSTGDAPNRSDIAVHKQICDINESPVFLKLNPATKHTDLPITVYESVIDIVDGKVPCSQYRRLCAEVNLGNAVIYFRGRKS